MNFLDISRKFLEISGHFPDISWNVPRTFPDNSRARTCPGNFLDSSRAIAWTFLWQFWTLRRFFLDIFCFFLNFPEHTRTISGHFRTFRDISVKSPGHFPAMSRKGPGNFQHFSRICLGNNSNFHGHFGKFPESRILPGHVRRIVREVSRTLLGNCRGIAKNCSGQILGNS